VLDKGLLDAMLPCRDSPDGGKEALAYLRACARLLAPGTGALLIVSLLQDHVLDLVLQHLAQAEVRCLWQGLDVTFLQPSAAAAREGAAAQQAALSPFLLVLRRSPLPYSDAPPPSASRSASSRGAAPLRMRVAGALLAPEGVPSAVRGLRWSQGPLRAGLSRLTGDTFLALDLWAASEGQQPAAAAAAATAAAAAAAAATATSGIGAITPSGTPTSTYFFPNSASASRTPSQSYVDSGSTTTSASPPPSTTAFLTQLPTSPRLSVA
jgi:hypothetical protein